MVAKKAVLICGCVLIVFLCAALYMFLRADAKWLEPPIRDYYVLAFKVKCQDEPSLVTFRKLVGGSLPSDYPGVDITCDMVSYPRYGWVSVYTFRSKVTDIQELSRSVDARVRVASQSSKFSYEWEMAVVGYEGTIMRYDPCFPRAGE